MSRIDELRQQKADLVAEGREILDAAENDQEGVLNEDQEARLAEIKTETTKLAGRIERLEEQQEAERALADGQFAKHAADKLPAQPRKDPEKFSSMGEFLSAVAAAGISGDKTGQMTDRRLVYGAATGAGEAVPADGGFLVQQDFRTDLLNEMHEMGTVMNRVRRIPISANSDSIKLPAVDESSRVDGSRWGAVQGYWADEGNTVTASRPKFRAIELSLKKLFALFYATDELLKDSTALEAVARQAFLEELTFKTEDAIINGDGSGKPLGLMNSGALLTVGAESGQAAATVVTANILNMMARLPIRSMRTAVWLINQDCLPQLWQLTLGSGTAVILLYRPPGYGGNTDLGFGTLMGRPILPIEYCATLGTEGDIILTDLSEYLMIEKGGVEQSSSMHVRFINDEMTFRWIYRLDGQPTRRTAITPFKGSATQSPYIALATRS